MFNRKFTDLLIFKITFSLSHSTDQDNRRCWCDDIVLPVGNGEDLKTQALQSKRIIAKALIDEGKMKDRLSGQHLYDLHINFGEQSLTCLKNNLSLMDCVPENHDWVALDMSRKVMEIQLR